MQVEIQRHPASSPDLVPGDYLIILKIERVTSKEPYRIRALEVFTKLDLKRVYAVRNLVKLQRIFVIHDYLLKFRVLLLNFNVSPTV